MNMINILFLMAKKLNVENFDISGQIRKSTASELKRVFGKSMAIDWFQSCFKCLSAGVA